MTTPSNRSRELSEKKLRRIVILQGLRIRSLERENARLLRKLKLIDSTIDGKLYKFFYKLAYACEVILKTVSKPFRSKKK